MEVDEEELPPVAAASAAMAHGLGGGATSGEPPTDAAAGAEGARSDSNTREYLESLPGSPFSDREPPVLPVVGVAWNDFDQIYAHMPVNERERAKRVQEVGLFNHAILKEYFRHT
eukprot:s1775_g15.t1